MPRMSRRLGRRDEGHPGDYGPDLVYVRMAARSLELWRENEKRWGRRLYHRTGALFSLPGFRTRTS